jgi:hypothetical protein
MKYCIEVNSYKHGNIVKLVDSCSTGGISEFRYK